MNVENFGSNGILYRFLNGTWLIRKDKNTGFYNLYYWSDLTNSWYSAGVGDYSLKKVESFFK